MKIKIPDLGTYDIRNYKYFVTKDDVFLLDKHTNGFIINNKKEKTRLPKRHHIYLLNNQKTRTKTATGFFIIELEE